MSNCAPLVSIIVPTYNRGEIISDTIVNLLSQTYKNIEIIIVDDGSNDNTEGVVREYTNGNVKYFRVYTNKGPAYARNLGIKKSQGKYIAFQDSDDKWLPSKISCQVNALENTNASVICIRGIRVEGDQSSVWPPSKYYNTGVKPEHQILHKNFITPLAILAERESIVNIGGFDESFPAFEEWDFAIRLIEESNPLFINDVLFVSNKRNDALSNSSYKMANGREKILLKHSHKISSDNVHAEHCYIIARSYIDARSPSKAFTFFLRAIYLNPLRFKYYISFLMSYVTYTLGAKNRN